MNNKYKFAKIFTILVNKKIIKIFVLITHFILKYFFHLYVKKYYYLNIENNKF